MVSAVNVAVAVAWSTIAWFAPSALGVRVFGASWETAHSILPAMALVTVVGCAASGAQAAIRTGQKVVSAIWINVVMALVLVPATAVAASKYSTNRALLVFGAFTAAGIGATWLLAIRFDLQKRWVKPSRL